MTAANKLLRNLKLHPDGIWGEVSDYRGQEEEKLLRESVSNHEHIDYLQAITKSHSIPVMDSEVEKFIQVMPKGGIVLDNGGCWGWHWRKIIDQRPDLTIVILDLIRENLVHAQKILIEGISKERVFLVHGNACSLQFDDKHLMGFGVCRLLNIFLIIMLHALKYTGFSNQKGFIGITG